MNILWLNPKKVFFYLMFVFWTRIWLVLFYFIGYNHFLTLEQNLLYFWITLLIPYLVRYIYLIILFAIKKNRRNKQAMDLKFLQIKIPRSMATTSTEIRADDHIQNMQQPINIMNQVYKNLYAIYKEDNKHKLLWEPFISMEIFLEKEVIKFIMAVPSEFVETIEKLISSFYPWSFVELIDQPKLLESWKFMYWWEITFLKKNIAPIKTYESFEVDPMDSILSSYSKVLDEEKLLLQVLISPIDKDLYEKLRKEVDDYKKCSKWRFKCMIRNLFKWLNDKEKDWESDDSKYDFSQQQLWDLDKKIEDELFEVRIRTLATSPQAHRPKKIISDLTKSFNQYNNIWLQSFVFKETENIHKFAKTVVLRTFFPDWTFKEKLDNYTNPIYLNIKELSSIIHFPHSRFNKNPRIVWQKFRIVPAPDNVPKEWMLLWYNTFGWVKRSIYLKPKDRFRHFYTIWQTWTWKSTMLLTMSMQDVKLWNWFCLIDPHWDLCEHILKYIPKERIDDLIYFDFANTEYPIWFNVFEWWETPDERDIIITDLIEMFENMYWKEIFGPRIQDYFRNWAALLMEQPEGWTLVEIMRLFTDEAYLESKLKNLTDPVIQTWRNKTYKSMWDREKQEIIPFLQAKFAPFTTWTYVRNVIWQPKSAFDFSKIMQEKKILLCNLSKWLTWEINSQLLWRMFAIQIKLHSLKRASIPEEERVPFFLYVDEFQNYVSQSFESILSEARKYRLGLIIAHQYIEQLKQSWLWWSIDLSKPIFWNVWSQLYLKVWPEDADFLEKNVTPEFSKADLLNMDRYKWILTLSIDTQPSRPFSLTCLNPYAQTPINSPEKVDIIKQISALKRWTKREVAEKEIFYRVWV